VKALSLISVAKQSSQPAAKRIKVTKDSPVLSWVTRELCKLIDAAPSEDARDIAELEHQFLLVFSSCVSICPMFCANRR
jgi:hypothetical protein